MPPKKEVQTIKYTSASKQVFVSGKEHLGTNCWNVCINKPQFKAGDPTPSTRMARFVDITDTDKHKPKEHYLQYSEKEKSKGPASTFKDFIIPDALRVVNSYSGEPTEKRYPKDLVMMMGVVAKMMAGSIPAFWWCIGLPFVRGSSQPAEVVVVTDLKKFYTDKWAAEKETEQKASKGKASTVQEIDEGEEDEESEDEESGEESEEEESGEESEEDSDDDDDEESDEEMIDDSSGSEEAQETDEEEVAPVSKRAVTKAKKSELESEDEASDSDDEDKPVSHLSKKKLAAKEAKKEEKKAKKLKESKKAAKKAKEAKEAKAAKKAAKKAKKAKKDAAKDDEGEEGEADAAEAMEEEAAEEEPAEEEREIPTTVDIFDREKGPNGTYYIDEETLGLLLDKIFFMYPYKVDIQLGFSENGLPFREGEKQRTAMEGGEPVEIGQRKPGEEGEVPFVKPEHPGEGAAKEAMEKYNAKLNMWEGAPYIKTRIHHKFWDECKRSPWDLMIMTELPDPIKKAVKEFVLSHNMAKRCPQLAHMSDYRAGHSFPWAKFIQAEQKRIAGVESAQRNYSIELRQRFHDEMVVHDATIWNRDKNGKPIDEGDKSTKAIPWMRKVIKEGYQGPVQDYSTHGRHSIDLSGRPDDLSPDQHQIAWNVDAMLGKIGTKRLAYITGSSQASSSGVKAQLAKTTPKSQQPAAKAQASGKATGKRKADELTQEQPEVMEAEDVEGKIIFTKPGIREAMADPELILTVCYTDAEGQTVSLDIPTDKTFEFIVRKKARKSPVKGGVLAIKG
jgi:hypothetical protein